MSLHSKWSDENVTILRRLWWDHSSREIADILSCDFTRNAVIGKARRLGLPMKQPPRFEGPRPKPEPKPKPTPMPTVKRKWRAPTMAQLQDGPPSLPQLPEPKPFAFTPQSEPVTIMELRGHHCRWPVGEPGTPEFRYCGAPRADMDQPRRPYCAEHEAIAYNKHQPKGIPFIPLPRVVPALVKAGGR